MYKDYSVRLRAEFAGDMKENRRIEKNKSTKNSTPHKNILQKWRL